MLINVRCYSIKTHCISVCKKTIYLINKVYPYAGEISNISSIFLLIFISDYKKSQFSFKVTYNLSDQHRVDDHQRGAI